MQAEFIERKDVVLRLTKTDSMGRTPKQRADMEANDRKPLKLSEATQAVHTIVAEEHAQFPRAMFRLALRNGLPAGDVKDPDYPLPLDLAKQCGLDNQGFKIIGQTRDSPGNVVVRLPWVTKLVGVVREDLSVDLEASKAEEARLLKLGWVHSPSQIKGLPLPPAEEPFDALPEDEPKPNGNGRTAR